MKKILITISRGFIARNLLQNDFYRILREQYTILILTSAARDARFREEFGHPNVSFTVPPKQQHTIFDRIISYLHRYLIYNDTVNNRSRWGVIGSTVSTEPMYVAYLLRKIIFLSLSKIRALRDVVRWVDYMFLQQKDVRFFNTLLESEQPALVVLTHISDDMDAALAKSAKGNGIPVVAMPKSWDNMNKNGFRAKADILAVWSEFMVEEARKFQNYTEEKIKIVGIPQFDRYVEKELLWSRHKFCEMFGLDPDRRIIFFGSEGKLFQSDAEIASVIHEFIKEEKLFKSCQLLIRPHFGYKDDELKFSHLFGKPYVVVDRYNNPSMSFRDSWDYSEEFSDRFMNTVYHSDIIISAYSTLSLDGVAFDKPIINIAFDGKETKPYKQSNVRWGADTYFKSVLDTGAIRDTKDTRDLQDAINEYLRDPSLRSAERAELRRRFCFKIDGKSGARFAEVLVEALQS